MGRSSQPKDGASAEMREAWRLFDAGDKVAARRAADRILTGSPDPIDRAQAEELLSRMKIPPLALALAGIVATLIALLLLLAKTRT